MPITQPAATTLPDTVARWLLSHLHDETSVLPNAFFPKSNDEPGKISVSNITGLTSEEGIWRLGKACFSNNITARGNLRRVLDIETVIVPSGHLSVELSPTRRCSAHCDIIVPGFSQDFQGAKPEKLHYASKLALNCTFIKKPTP